MAAQPPVLVSEEGGIGLITLNRPKALNSLNTEMVALAYEAYRRWSAPGSGVRAVLLSGAGGKAFCAGGDVKSAAQQAAAGDVAGAMLFFRAEYLCDAAISRLPLPHVALLDGITMGGGAGISMHGHFRVATERTLFAMPECAIGLFPDVGMMALLPRLPGELGAYLALTGARLTGAQVKEAGLATHFIPSSHLPLIRQQLQQAGPAAADPTEVHAILTRIEAAAAAAAGAAGEQQPAPGPSLTQRLPIISRCFGHASVAEVVAALRAERADPQWSSEALQQLQRGSPLSAAISLAYYRRSRARRWGALECLEQDCLLAGHFMAGQGDFVEGVRARLVDKDEAPRWKHAGHDQVSPELVERFFAPRQPSDAIDLRQLLGEPAAGSPARARL